MGEPRRTVGHFLRLPGLELQSLSLANPSYSPEGKFTFKKRREKKEKKKERFQLAQAASKGKRSPKGPPFLFFSSEKPPDIFLRKSLLALYLPKVIRRKTSFGKEVLMRAVWRNIALSKCVCSGLRGGGQSQCQLLSPLIRRSVHLRLQRHVRFTHVNGEGSRCC